MWSPGVTLESIEKQVILTAFSFYHQNKTATANALGIAIRTLDSKLEKYETDGKAEEKRHAEHMQRQHEWLIKQRGGAGYGETQASQEVLVGAPAGVRMESTPHPATQSAVSVHVGKEVQGVLPKQAPKSDSRRSR